MEQPFKHSYFPIVWGVSAQAYRNTRLPRLRSQLRSDTYSDIWSLTDITIFVVPNGPNRIRVIFFVAYLKKHLRWCHLLRVSPQSLPRLVRPNWAWRSINQIEASFPVDKTATQTAIYFALWNKILQDRAWFQIYKLRMGNQRQQGSAGYFKARFTKRYKRKFFWNLTISSLLYLSSSISVLRNQITSDLSLMFFTVQTLFAIKILIEKFN